MDMRAKLKALRDCNIKIASIAELANISSQALYMYMNETNKELSQETFYRLNEVLKKVSNDLQTALTALRGGSEKK